MPGPCVLEALERKVCSLLVRETEVFLQVTTGSRPSCVQYLIPAAGSSGFSLLLRLENRTEQYTYLYLYLLVFSYQHWVFVDFVVSIDFNLISCLVPLFQSLSFCLVTGRLWTCVAVPILALTLGRLTLETLSMLPHLHPRPWAQGYESLFIWLFLAGF